MKYLLDTNVVVDLIRNNDSVIKHLVKCGAENCCISDYSLYELFYGVYKSGHAEREFQVVSKIVNCFDVVPFSDYVLEASRQKDFLEKKGQKIEDADVLIGSASVAKNCVLVTNNIKHMSRLDGVTIENWRD